MATIREIVNKSVELKAEAEKLEALNDDRALAQQRVAEVNGQIMTQQPIVQSLIAELKLMVNE